MNKRIVGDECWRELLRAQETSGLRVEEFCLRQKICRTSFYAWRKRFRMVNCPAEIIAPPAVIKRYGKSFKSGFMRIMPPVSALTAMSIQTPNGYRVEMSPTREDLRIVFEILRAL